MYMYMYVYILHSCFLLHILYFSVLHIIAGFNESYMIWQEVVDNGAKVMQFRKHCLECLVYLFS